MSARSRSLRGHVYYYAQEGMRAGVTGRSVPVADHRRVGLCDDLRAHITLAVLRKPAHF